MRTWIKGLLFYGGVLVVLPVTLIALTIGGGGEFQGFGPAPRYEVHQLVVSADKGLLWLAEEGEPGQPFPMCDELFDAVGSVNPWDPTTIFTISISCIAIVEE